jgi:hypothetical protein
MKRLSRPSLWHCVIGAAALPFLGCGAGQGPDEGTSQAATYIAFERSFLEFRSWPSHHFIATEPTAGDVHTSGPRTEYINTQPPTGSVAFPLGTIIVKEIESDDLHRTFAMVKRGGTFNVTGAIAWEWFELYDVDTHPKILWRGVGPPSDKVYGGDPNTGCNGCHAAANGNDSVLSDALNLSHF